MSTFQSNVLSFDHGTISLNGTDYPLNSVSVTPVSVPSTETNPISEKVRNWAMGILVVSGLGVYGAIGKKDVGSALIWLIVGVVCAGVLWKRMQWQRPSDRHGIRFRTTFNEEHLIYGTSAQFRDEVVTKLRLARTAANAGSFYVDFRTQTFNDNRVQNIYHLAPQSNAFTQEQVDYITRALQPSIDRLSERLQRNDDAARKQELAQLVAEINASQPKKGKLLAIWEHLKMAKDVQDLCASGYDLGKHLSTLISWL